MLKRDLDQVNQLLQAIDRITEYTSSVSGSDELMQKTVLYDATLMNFIVLGETVDRLSDEFKDANHQIPWFKVKSFRNIIAHDYFGIDPEEVWDIIQNHLPILHHQLRSLT